MTKVICNTIDKTFSHFEVCELHTSAARHSPTLSVVVKLYQLPLTNLHLQMEFSRYDTKSSNNILNNTWDVCRFLKNINKYRALRIFYDLMKEYSNINHTCPYNVSCFASFLMFFNLNLFCLYFPSMTLKC